ncbi:MAG: low molecular weight phosphotyrosine protein phosphatase [Cyclobacteriaceae bacterium]|nr:low molecular weight phosphotyrosine protein phosphatase [Cyclobacteriaceae bacterium]
MKVLFVCLGNICRSPMAAAIFNHKIRQQGLSYQCDSCGTGDYHIGGPADYRTLAVAQKNGVKVNHTARQLSDADLNEFDYIFAMDKNNQRNILRLPSAEVNKQKIKLMREYDPKGLGDVPDPYHGTEADFQEVFEILDRSIDSFIANLKSKTA